MEETMAIKQTTKRMVELLDAMLIDLEKAERGNKTAAQRVRTFSIEFTKVSKTYRKESMPKKAAVKKKAAKKKGTKRKK
ncbi:MAG: hypothetical protein S4CHLAM102_14060 [Chlamydiia bacterium]|nr:hypothetical protein [Chlamydiia bacterium]